MRRNIFVFGSNTEGHHGAGAALDAVNNFGAIQGVPMGLQGNSYGIITKHLPDGERSVSLEFIAAQVSVFLYFSQKHPKWLFQVTRIGCGHAGFKEEEIAPMFKLVRDLRYDNVALCPEFNQWLHIDLLKSRGLYDKDRSMD